MVGIRTTLLLAWPLSFQSLLCISIKHRIQPHGGRAGNFYWVNGYFSEIYFIVTAVSDEVGDSIHCTVRWRAEKMVSIH